MSKASSVVAIVTQQYRQRVPQSRTEYRERPPHEFRRHDELMTSGGACLCAISETGTHCTVDSYRLTANFCIVTDRMYIITV